MQNKNFRKRQGVSLKKLQAFNLTKNILMYKQKTEEKCQNTSPNKFSNIKLLKDKAPNLRSKTARNTESDANRYFNQLIFESKKSFNPKNKTRFTRFPLNSPITQCDENVHHLIEQIVPKANGFYRFGMKSYENPSHKRVYSDIMNMPIEKTDGVMYVGELWTNDMSKKFLKLNKMNMNKLKFFEKLRDLRWEQISKEKEREKETVSNNVINSIKNISQKSLKSFQTISHFESLQSLQYFKTEEDIEIETLSDEKETEKILRLQKLEMNLKEYKDVISSIRNTIDEEQNRCRGQKYWKNMKDLETESHQMHKLWTKYFAKLIEIS